MSDFPGEITKQSRVTPARSIRSTRYSLTARGRSMPSVSRLPTGRSSLEKARGWMRLPAPAAGTIPHISTSPGAGRGGRRGWEGRSAGLLNQHDQLPGAAVRRVLLQGPGARGAADRADLLLRPGESVHHVPCVARHDHLSSGLEETVQPLPGVAHDR